MDFLDNYELIPYEVMAVIQSFDEEAPNRYKECERIITTIEKLGWTGDYGLDGELSTITPLVETPCIFLVKGEDMATHNKRTAGYVMLTEVGEHIPHLDTFINLVKSKETIFEKIGGLYADADGYIVYDEQHESDTFDFRSHQYKLVYPEDFEMNEYLAYLNFKN